MRPAAIGLSLSDSGTACAACIHNVLSNLRHPGSARQSTFWKATSAEPATPRCASFYQHHRGRRQHFTSTSPRGGAPEHADHDLGLWHEAMALARGLPEGPFLFLPVCSRSVRSTRRCGGTRRQRGNGSIYLRGWVRGRPFGRTRLVNTLRDESSLTSASATSTISTASKRRGAGSLRNVP